MNRGLVLAGTGAALGIYGWSLVRSMTLAALDDDHDVEENFMVGGHDPLSDEICEHCDISESEFGPEGVLTSGKLRSIAQWLEFSEETIRNALAADPNGSWFSEEQKEWFLGGFSVQGMVDDMESWADSLENDEDPTEI